MPEKVKVSEEQINQVMERFSNDADFRQSLTENPKEALANSGLDLSSEQVASLVDMDWSNDDQQLRARISKRMSRHC